jgi:hypothetical protein
MGDPLLLVEDILFCGFLIVYLYLAFDMVAVFIPGIRRRAYGPNEQRGVLVPTEQEER